MPVQNFEAASADDLAAAIFKFARLKLAASWFEVVVDLETGTGSIEYGRFGTFTFIEIPDE